MLTQFRATHDLRPATLWSSTFCNACDQGVRSSQAGGRRATFAAPPRSEVT
jgi:hypothetical protein